MFVEFYHILVIAAVIAFKHAMLPAVVNNYHAASLKTY